MKNNNIYYFYFHRNDMLKEQLTYIPTAEPKMCYIIEKVKEVGKRITIVSCVNSTQGWFGRKEIEIDQQQREIYFTTFSSKNRILSKVNAIIKYLQILLFVLIDIRKNDTVLIYHSLYFLPLVYVLKLKQVQIIIEVEEIYADVLDTINEHVHKNEIIRKKEKKSIALADKYICVSDALAEMVSDGKPFCVLSGIYKVLQKEKKTKPIDTIHLVYSGTFSKGKGCDMAVKAACLLDKGYVLHISGFGTNEEIEWIQDRVEQQNRGNGCRMIYHGFLSQEENNRLLQECHVGLCTQNISAKFNETSFPSKILTYLGNGLRVIAVRMNVLEQSPVGDLIYYYDEDSPEAIAEVVQKIDFSENYDSREYIKRLDEKFMRDIKELLDDK